MHCLLLSPSPVLVDLFSYTDLTTSSPQSREKLTAVPLQVYIFRLIFVFFRGLFFRQFSSAPRCG